MYRVCVHTEVLLQFLPFGEFLSLRQRIPNVVGSVFKARFPLSKPRDLYNITYFLGWFCKAAARSHYNCMRIGQGLSKMLSIEWYLIENICIFNRNHLSFWLKMVWQRFGLRMQGRLSSPGLGGQGWWSPSCTVKWPWHGHYMEGQGKATDDKETIFSQEIVWIKKTKFELGRIYM